MIRLRCSESRTQSSVDRSGTGKDAKSLTAFAPSIEHRVLHGDRERRQCSDMINNSFTDSSNPPPCTVQRRTAGAIVTLGTLLDILAGAGILGEGASDVVTSQQGSDGYFTSPTRPFSTTSYALSSPLAQIAVEKLPFDLGSLRINATSTAPGGQVFVGIGLKAEVEKYLNGVHATEIIGITTMPFRVSYRDLPGSTAPEPPSGQSFWTMQASGTGSQQITMDLRTRDWVVVIINADASEGVAVNVQDGYRSELFRTLTPALSIAGIVLLLIWVGLIALGAIGLDRRSSASKYGTPVRPTVDPSDSSRKFNADPLELKKNDGASLEARAPTKRYPARLTGHLDPPLSRGQRLVKWLLSVPNFIILLFMCSAVIVTTIIARFAILFTGRYPRSLFNFAVGVLRWKWRVGFYACSALGTDKYPPFSLAMTDYPVDFEVDYPQQLSHGLVRAKGWLLVVPHLLIVSVFTNTAWTAWNENGNGSQWAGHHTWSADFGHSVGFSLLSLLVLIAALMLLSTGRYQRPPFGLVMGINRWTYCVATHGLLLRDKYPPFRLDQGHEDPRPAVVLTRMHSLKPADVPTPPQEWVLYLFRVNSIPSPLLRRSVTLGVPIEFTAAA